ncbi:hypothetical protein AKJ16_DCAP24506 [Drosera capensis]
MSLVMQSQRFVGSPMMSSSVVHGLSSTRWLMGFDMLVALLCIWRESELSRLSNVVPRQMSRMCFGPQEKSNGSSSLLMRMVSGKKSYPICEFLNHPSGIETVLNINALESWELLGSNTYRCKLPRIQLLRFEVSPSMVLQVNPTNEDCTVELLSCKFEGSDIVEKQNEHFSASMKNHITWDTSASESFLNVDVSLKIHIEIYNPPLPLLPVSAIEVPGNINYCKTMKIGCWSRVKILYEFRLLHIHFDTGVRPPFASISYAFGSASKSLPLYSHGSLIVLQFSTADPSNFGRLTIGLHVLSFWSCLSAKPCAGLFNQERKMRRQTVTHTNRLFNNHEDVCQKHPRLRIPLARASSIVSEYWSQLIPHQPQHLRISSTAFQQFTVTNKQQNSWASSTTQYMKFIRDPYDKANVTQKLI